MRSVSSEPTSARLHGLGGLAILLAGLAAPDLRAEPVAAEPAVAEIERLCRRTYELGQRGQGQVRHFAELTRMSGAAGPREFWREFPSVAALQKATRSDELRAFTQMKYWAVPEGFSYVDTFFTSDSGDWSNLAEYCFRADGSLAREEATNNNISMGIRSWRVRYFDEAGRTIKTQRQVYKIDNDKPIAMSNFQAPDNPLYKQLRRVPFYRFINNDK